MDNEEDFVSEIAVQLQNFLQNNPKIDKKKVIPLLESMLLFDDPVIRKHSIEVVKITARENFEEIVNLIKTLIQY